MILFFKHGNNQYSETSVLRYITMCWITSFINVPDLTTCMHIKFVEYS